MTMNRITRLWATLIAGMLTALTLPGVAWADDAGVADVLRRGRGTGFFGACSAFCCLFVVGGVVLAIVLITRNRNNRQIPPQ
jgi:hypothetical protein